MYLLNLKSYQFNNLSERCLKLKNMILLNSFLNIMYIDRYGKNIQPNIIKHMELYKLYLHRILHMYLNIKYSLIYMK